MNIGGLAIALASFITILLFVDFQMSYDKWDKELNRVYRIGIHSTFNGTVRNSSYSQYLLNSILKYNCPGLECLTSVKLETSYRSMVVAFADKKFYEKKVIDADSGFFKIFPYKFRYGSPATALTNPNSVIITSDICSKLFKNENPLGRLITMSSIFDSGQKYIVTGVIEKTGPSHLDFDYCRSININSGDRKWGNNNVINYVLIKKNTRLKDIVGTAEKLYDRRNKDYLQSLPQEIRNDLKGLNAALIFQPVGQIHLRPLTDNPVSLFTSNSGTANYLKEIIIFSLIGIALLMIACINYTNLSIAGSADRAKEASLRRVFGSNRRELISRFLVDSFLQVLIALFLSLIIVELLLPFINHRFDFNLSLLQPGSQGLSRACELALILLLTTLLAGGYPAFFLSIYDISYVIKGNITKGARGKMLRNTLIATQFTLALIFVTGMIIIFGQLNYMKTKYPGFKTENILCLQVYKFNTFNNYRQYLYVKDALMRIPGVEAVSGASSFPSLQEFSQSGAIHQGDTIMLKETSIDYGYFRLFNMKLLEGRGFSPLYSSDTISAAILNQTAVSAFHFKNPVGQTIMIRGRNYRVIGVLQDNYNNGFETAIEPTLYAVNMKNNGYGYILIKLNSLNNTTAIAGIERLWSTVEPGFPASYSWVDQDFADLSSKYEKLGSLFFLFTVMSVLIAVSGIFALTAFMAEQRTKEIGIRKVMGASVKDILALLNKDFILVVLLSNIIAWPVTYLFARKWLDGFAYRIDMPLHIFMIVAIVSLLITVASVTLQASRAALANPVKTLRYE